MSGTGEGVRSTGRGAGQFVMGFMVKLSLFTLRTLALWFQLVVGSKPRVTRVFEIFVSRIGLN